MNRFTTVDGVLEWFAEVRGYGIYLDNDSLFEMAMHSDLRRERFVQAVRRGGTLLFSWTNSIEVAGLGSASSAAVRRFLDSIGPHWVPLEISPWAAVDKERAGRTSQAAVSESFMRAYFQDRAYELSPGGHNLLDLSEVFFRLGTVADWAQKNREWIKDSKVRVAQGFRDLLTPLRDRYDGDPASLDRVLPSIRFDERYPASFACVHLQRLLVREWKAYRFTDNDALDFCHAVLAAAYGSIAALDRQWKRRVESLPQPNRLAKVYYRPELDQLVDMLVSLVTSK